MASYHRFTDLGPKPKIRGFQGPPLFREESSEISWARMDKESLSSLKDCVLGVTVAPKNVNFLRTDPEILGPIDFMIS